LLHSFIKLKATVCLKRLCVIGLSDGPRSTSITNSNGNPIGNKLYPGDKIICSSTSNPAVSQYKWINATDNSTRGEAQELTILTSWVGEASMRCEVRNFMGPTGSTVGMHSAEVYFTVEGKLFNKY
jgi:hypothetical protein